MTLHKVLNTAKANMPFMILVVCLILTTGCGTCPKMSYRGALKPEDMNFIRDRVAEKKIDVKEKKMLPDRLALHCIFVPLYLDFRTLEVYNPSYNGGPYYYNEFNASGFPLTVWDSMTERSISEDGNEISYVDFNGVLAGVIGSWGEFQYKNRECVPPSFGKTRIFTGMGILPGLIYPSRWFFTGKEGYYWNSPLFLFGYVSSDTSKTFHILNGLIPIRFSNTEKVENNL